MRKSETVGLGVGSFHPRPCTPEVGTVPTAQLASVRSGDRRHCLRPRAYKSSLPARSTSLTLPSDRPSRLSLGELPGSTSSLGADASYRP